MFENITILCKFVEVSCQMCAIQFRQSLKIPMCFDISVVLARSVHKKATTDICDGLCVRIIKK